MFRIEQDRAEAHPTAFRRMSRIGFRSGPVTAVLREVVFRARVQPAENVLRRHAADARTDAGPGRTGVFPVPVSVSVSFGCAEEDAAARFAAARMRCPRAKESSIAEAAATGDDDDDGDDVDEPDVVSPEFCLSVL